MNLKMTLINLSLIIITGFNLTASSLEKMPSGRAYTKAQLKRINQLENDLDWDHSSNSLSELDQIKIVMRALQNGIDVNDVSQGYLLSNTLYLEEQYLATFLVQNGGDVNKREPLQYVTWLS